MSTLLSLTLLLSFILLTTHALPDFCNADPRIHFHHTQCQADHPSSLAIFINYLPYNPFHSVHDHLWALSHYLSHCTHQSQQRFIFAGTENFDMSLCALPESAAPKTEFGLWMPCVFHIIAWFNGIPSKNLQPFPDNDEWPKLSTTGNRCFETSVLFGVDPVDYQVKGYGKTKRYFRGTSWYGADCGGTSEQGSCAHLNATSAVIPLPDSYKGTAMRNIRTAVYNYLQVENTVMQDHHINVLVYDRNDTKWRQWTNAGQIVAHLEADKRLNVRYIRTTPVSFRSQIETYYWADIVVAPHGAAMASTFFMRPGADIVEIFTSCDADVLQNRYMPQKWTGWHPHLLDLHLQYVQCHLADGPIKKREQLESNPDALYVVTGKPHRVLKEDLMPVLNSAIYRQVGRVGRRRQFEQSTFGVEREQTPVVHFELDFIDWYRVCFGTALMIVATALVAMQRVGRSKKTSTSIRGVKW